MDYQQAVDYLDRHIGAGYKPGLDRIATLMEMMGHPEDGYPIIHVAGTNGKTTTCRLATMLIVAHGLNAGTFISPHLERIEERISANGRNATAEEFAQAVTDVAAFADIYEERYHQSLTYFELTAAMAFAWFAELAVDAAVIEVGLGGRLDATNVARGEVAVVTSIGLEHMEVLGDTHEKIAVEKLGIVKPGCVLVTGALPEAALAVARDVADEKKVRHLHLGSDFNVEEATRAVGGWYARISGVYREYDDILLPLHGRHQITNLAVAVAAVEALLGRPLDPEAVRQGALASRSPGRMELIPGTPTLLLDGAHNPEGFAALAAALKEEFPGRSFILLTAAMEDKDLGTMLPALHGHVDQVVATRVNSPRALAPEALAATASRLLNVPAVSAHDPEAALNAARQIAGEEGAILVTGSLYLVGAVRSLVLGEGAAQRNER